MAAAAAAVSSCVKACTRFSSCGHCVCGTLFLYRAVNLSGCHRSAALLKAARSATAACSSVEAEKRTSPPAPLDRRQPPLPLDSSKLQLWLLLQNLLPQHWPPPSLPPSGSDSAASATERRSDSSWAAVAGQGTSSSVTVSSVIRSNSAHLAPPTDHAAR